MDHDMSRPVPGEAENLSLHVEMCARRHGQTVAELRALHDSAAAIKADMAELKRHAAVTKRAMWVCGALLLSAVSGGALTAEQIIRALQVVTQHAEAPQRLPAPATGYYAGTR